MLLAGDGRLYTQGAVPAVFPGPLLPSIMVAQLDESQVQAILRVVADAGLLAAPPDYSGGSNVADAANTVLTVTAGGSTYEHSAYALGIGDPETPARAKLLDVVNRVTELSTSEAAAATPFAADWYRLRATPIDPTQVGTQDPQPSVVDWPGLRISLAAAKDCTRVSASDAGTFFTEAKQNTYFRDAGVVYQVAVRGVLPGDPAC
jgi:hypothetical protein